MARVTNDAYTGDSNMNYPIDLEHLGAYNYGLIVRFTSARVGTVVRADKRGYYYVGEFSRHWTDSTNRRTWVPVAKGQGAIII